jgi:hypothetical protein
MCSRRRRFVRQTVISVVTSGVGIAVAWAPAASSQGLHVVAGGLDNPRGMTFGPGEALYVAEAGRGGAGPCIPAPNPGPLTCYGASGAITRIDPKSGKKRRIVRGLPSLAPQEGGTPGETVGPQDISFAGRTGYFTVGLGSNPAARAQLGSAGPDFAGLYSVTPAGTVRRVADLGAYEAANDPDAGRPSAAIDTNPYAVDATRPSKILVTDAGANDLLRVTPTGDVRTLAVFGFGQTTAPPSSGMPPGTQIPYQPVPTGVARGAGGSAYVGTLTGFPFPVGAATLLRTNGAAKPQVVAGGFTTIVDVAVGKRNSIYVLQISSQGLAGPPSPGKLIRVAANGTTTELATGLLKQPTGLAVSRRGDVYVANNGMSAGSAQIVRIE